jgi:hypothetical protein
LQPEAEIDDRSFGLSKRCFDVVTGERKSAAVRNRQQTQPAELALNSGKGSPVYPDKLSRWQAEAPLAEHIGTIWKTASSQRVVFSRALSFFSYFRLSRSAKVLRASFPGRSRILL